MELLTQIGFLLFGVIVLILDSKIRKLQSKVETLENRSFIKTKVISNLIDDSHKLSERLDELEKDKGES
jgi:hypothetical protein